MAEKKVDLMVALMAIALVELLGIKMVDRKAAMMAD
jgi:hypothetical protein